jgi:catechol 2,3-dioxygenase-like lactoylglutathione lyase family enzyme
VNWSADTSRGLAAKESPSATAASFAHVALSVSSLHRSLAFYRDGLGFAAGDIYSSAGRRVAALMDVPPTGFRGVFLRYGAVHIELLEFRDALTPTASRDARSIGYTHISLIVPSVSQAVRTAVDHGGTLCAELAHTFGDQDPTRIVFVADPDHNRVELIEHPDGAERMAHSRFLGCDVLGWPTTR